MKSLIYIVDDNEMMRLFLENLLNEEYHTKSFATSEELLNDLTGDILPDIILLDQNLEDVRGIDILKSVKASVYTEHIAVIFISGEEKSETRIAVLEAGADDYILKPFNPQELKLRIRRVLKQSINEIL
jgi:DNA-binding response OmpR family regulator